MKKILTSKGVIQLSVPDNPRLNNSGEFYMVCPICTSNRKPQHQKEKKFAINLAKHPVPWRCNHCQESGYILDENYINSLSIKPITENVIWNDLSDGIINYFKDINIPVETLAHFKIKQSLEPIRQNRNPNEEKIGKVLLTKAINYPYFADGILTNIKFRDQRKNFKMIIGATKTFYNLDSLKNHSYGVIVEGENDALSYYTAGIEPVVSVPNGAQISDKEREHYLKTGEVTLPSEYDLEYLDVSIDKFEHLDVIYIATDDDPAGIKLREQIARRLGKDRCKYIVFSKYKMEDGRPCKDANDVLKSNGAYVLKSTLDTAISYPLENVTTAAEYKDEMKQDYLEGRSKGLPTGWKSLDPHFNWMRGWTYVVNGFPGQGKSTIMFNLILMATLLYKWKVAVYLPENYPEKNVISTMAEIMIGNTSDPKYSSRARWDEMEQIIKNHIDKYIFFMNNEKGFSPEDLREKKEILVRRKGIVMFFGDPWLALNHPMRTKFSSIDEYINYQLNYEIRQAQKLNLINIYAHHPPTPIRSKDKEYPAPSAFELIGGQIWYNKVFGIACIHRNDNNDFSNTMTEFHVQKQKEEKLAGIKTKRDDPVLFKFNRRSSRIYEKTDLLDENAEYDYCPFDDFDLKKDEDIDMDF